MRFTYPRDMWFACSCCGICCGDTQAKTRHVLLTRADANRIANCSKTKIEDFSTKLIGRDPYKFEMKKNLTTGKCIFLVENKCLIYENRPLICRFYPFELSSDENGTLVFTPTAECSELDKKENGAKRLGVKYFRDLLRLAAQEMDQLQT